MAIPPAALNQAANLPWNGSRDVRLKVRTIATVALCTVIVCCIGLVCVCLPSSRLSRMHRERSRESVSRLRVKGVLLRLPQRMPGGPPATPTLSLIEELGFEKAIGSGVDQMSGMNRERGTIDDAWGRPIWLRWTEDCAVEVISFGANGRDEGGGGDDIVERFPLSAWAALTSSQSDCPFLSTTDD